ILTGSVIHLIFYRSALKNRQGLNPRKMAVMYGSVNCGYCAVANGRHALIKTRFLLSKECITRAVQLCRHYFVDVRRVCYAGKNSSTVVEIINEDVFLYRKWLE